MQTVSDLFKSKIKEASREFECKITIGDNIYTNEDLVDIKIVNGIPGDGFMIGATPSATLDLTLLNRGDTIYSTNQIKIEIGLNIGSKFEYLLMGKFNIDEVEKTDYTVKFTAYDNMIKFETAYFSALGDNPTLQQVVNELATKTGVQFTGTLPAYNVKKLEGFTCREVLGYVASLCGGNALITRDGKFTIVTHKDVGYTITPDNYIPPFNLEEVKYKVGKVSCQVGEEVLSKGSLGTDSMELQFENPWITATILTDIYNKLTGFNYLGYSLKWQGDISLDIGDIVSVTDIRGVVRKLPILNQELNYIGGLTSTISAKGETKNKNSFNSSGSMSNKVNRLVTEQAIIKEAIIEKANISDLKTTNAEIANLKVKDTEIENALIKKATIEQLNAANANIQNLIAEDARINNLVASKASITELNAVSAKIGTVEADTAIIKDLLAGNVTAGSGQIIHLTAKNVTIEDAVIKNLIATKLSVADLMAGTINTNKFTIASTDGGLNIVGPTIQWKDKNNKIRMQAGKDAQGNFTFLLVGEDGTTALLDQTGIKKGAIANDLIVSDMISENAIGEKQINYSSLITGLNKDDNTSLIKASKVAIDLTGQSLEVAFNSLKSNVNDMENITQNLQTQITANNGKIEALIKDTTITEGSSSTSLKDAYISLKATVNGLNSTVASHTSSISTVTTELGKVDGKINTAKADAISTAGADATSKANNALNSAKSYTNAQITTVNTRVSNAESSINQLKDSITQKVWQTDIDKSITIANTIPDVRDTNELPSWYRKNYPKQVVKEFKRRSTIGAPGSAAYGMLETTISWSDKSGGIIIQVFSSSDGTYERRGSADDTTWGTWRTIEDTVGSQNKINNFNTSIVQPIKNEVTSVKSRTATLETNLNGITSKVTNLESTTSTINGKVNAQETRLQSTEQKVTATGVITTITEAINAGTNSLTTMQFVLDKNGVTVKNGGIRILNNSNEEVLKQDIQGGIELQGSIISKDSSGKKKYALDGQALKLYDWSVSTDRVAGAIESRKTNDTETVGMCIITRDNKFITIGYVGTALDDITSESSYPFMRFEEPNNNVYGYPIKVYKNMHLRGNALALSESANTGYSSYIKATGATIGVYSPSGGSYKMYELQDSRTGKVAQRITPTAHDVYADQFWCSGIIHAAGNMSCGGQKTRVVKTKSYGERLLTAYETADCLFADYGSGIINEDGECIIDIDDIFSETVDTNQVYRVFLTEFNEDDSLKNTILKVVKKEKRYFIVKGTPGLKFDWNIVMKQIDFNNDRLKNKFVNEAMSTKISPNQLINLDEFDKAKSNIEENEKEIIDLFKIKTSEDVLLEDILK